MHADASISERLKSIRESFDYTQTRMGEAIGATLRSWQEYEAGRRKPNSDAMAGLARLGVNLNWVLTGDGPMMVAPDERRAQELMARDVFGGENLFEAREAEAAYLAQKRHLAEFDQVPLYDVRAAAGAGAVVDQEDPVSMLAFRRDWLRQELGASARDLAAISAEGESMVPIITPGDVLLVDLRDTGPSRDGIYVLRLDNALVVKRIQRLPGRRLLLKSEHPAYEPYELAQEDLDGNGTAVIGRVVWAGRRM